MRSLLLVLGLMVAASSMARADSPKSVPATKEQKPIEDWKEDPVCRLVFFAVLEGLYEDGVSSEAVDNILGRKKDSPANIKATFVIQCPLCHPVYEAFRLYQQRLVLEGGKRDTFGKGVGQELETRLRSDILRTRQSALQTLVHRWVDRRLSALRLTDDEKRVWAEKLEARSQQGTVLLSQLA